MLCTGYAAVDSTCECSSDELSANHQRFITTSGANTSRHPHTHTLLGRYATAYFTRPAVIQLEDVFLLPKKRGREKTEGAKREKEAC